MTLPGIQSGPMAHAAPVADFSMTISTNQQEINLATLATSNGWDGSTTATITVNADVYIWSDSIGTPALTVGVFSGGLTLNNNGFIMGKGGRGASKSFGTSGEGENGGPAILLGSDITLNNGASGYVGGGGGGGASYANGYTAGGGGAGGGRGGIDPAEGFNVPGGLPGDSGENGVTWGGSIQSGKGGGSGGGATSYSKTVIMAGGGGGRIFPGVGGAPHVDGGWGGDSSTEGGLGIAYTGGGGGGGWGADGGEDDAANNPGGTGGKAIDLNGFTCTLEGTTSQIFGVVS